MRLTPMAAAASLCLLAACNNNAPDSHAGGDNHIDTTRIYVRKNIYTLNPNGAEITALRRGVDSMMRRQPDDPTSWSYQAAIHGTYRTPAKSGWNACQHGSYFFLSWHRMYLYYFERILRKASGDTNFALPYWNYSDVDSQRVMPFAFRTGHLPNGDTNYLCVSERNPGINRGDALPATAILYRNAFLKTAFSTTIRTDTGFGGLKVSAPIHFNVPHGALERQPHDQVHGAIGKWMGDPNTAAQDPIFWLHHANIDRLWPKWLAQGGGRTDPNDSVWLNTRFMFFDENKNAVYLTGRQIIQTTSLGYRYDDQRTAPAPLDIIECAPSAANHDTLPSETLLQAGPAATKGLRTNIPLSGNKGALTRLRQTDRLLMLDLQGITYDQMPTGVFEVYVNLPPGAKNPQPSDIYYAGNISLFGIMAHHGMEHGELQGGETVLDVTSLLCNLRKKQGPITAVTVTLILRGNTPAKGEKPILPAGSIRVGRTQLIVL